MAKPNRGIVVFSGGSAANNLVDVFEGVRAGKNCPLSYIIPISDNGGSSSELIRVFGGPGIGDVRSRLVRLIPTSAPGTERHAIQALFNHRLPSTSPIEAQSEWYSIVSGTSPLWANITSAKKEAIRSFLNHLNLEILKRARPPSSTFDFSSASVGNLFLTGARLFMGSFESAIYLLGTLCSVPDELVRVIPAINSNFSHHISAGLEDGTTIVGQNSISHPSIPSAVEPILGHRTRSFSITDLSPKIPDQNADDREEDAHLPGTHPSLLGSAISFTKDHCLVDNLPSRIERVWYINPYGQEIRPPPNLRVLESIRESQAVIYSIGSLYTSLIPNLILRGVGDAIRTSQARWKILILNGSLDRETIGTNGVPFTALDFVNAVTKALDESRASSNSNGTSTPNPSLTPNPNDATPTSQTPSLLSPTYRPQTSSSTTSSSSASTLSTSAPAPTFFPPPPPNPYITHLIHLSGPGTPSVDKALLASMGVECIRLYGRPDIDANGAVVGMRYDGNALMGALETILGRKGMGSDAGGRSRRNTLEG